MRIEPFSVGSIIHVTKRGTRGMDIVRDSNDQYRFVRSLFLLNDIYMGANWHRETSGLHPFERPNYWPEREPLVQILAWTLLSNHFHLLLKEIREGGTAKFMQRFCGSMSLCFNLKYGERGSIFQNAYHSRTVETDEHFNYLVFYILVKNTLEMYPGGLIAALADFDTAWQWALSYNFSSLGKQIVDARFPIIDDPEGLVHNVMSDSDAYKKEARELVAFHLNTKGSEFTDIMLEEW